MIYPVLNIVSASDSNIKIGFNLKTMMLTLIKGSFNNVEGEIKWNIDKFDNNRISLSADAKTINTSLLERDVLFKSGNHLNVIMFEKLRLEANHFIKKSNYFYAVAKLTIKDITNDVVIKVKLNQKMSMLDCSFSFNRFDYELGEPSKTFEDEIKVCIQAHLDK